MYDVTRKSDTLASANPSDNSYMEKIYVLDTNVLLHDPNAVMVFNEHKIVIPMTVLEELDNIKDRKDKDVSREARIAIGVIDKILANASSNDIQNGVDIPSARENQPKLGKLAIYPDQQLVVDHADIPFLSTSTQHDNDNRIINVALILQKQNPDAYVCLVTKDINMRLKAKGSGLANVEDYRRDRVLEDIALLASGFY